MPAYVIVEARVHDLETYRPYMAASPGAVAASGGRFLVRGGKVTVLEGDWQPERVVVAEFDDLDAARSWYASDAYQAAKALREGAADLQMFAVAGTDLRPTAANGASAPAYVIVDAEVSDADKFSAYREAAGPAAEAYGGRYLVRGGETASLEGSWEPQRVVVAEFPDLESATRWYESPEYAHARSLREGAATMKIIAVEGV